MNDTDREATIKSFRRSASPHGMSCADYLSSPNKKIKEEKMEHTSSEVHVSPQSRDATYKTVSGVSMVEAIGGVAALVLGILGLTGTIPGILAACAAMALGVALAIQGGGMAARYEEIAAVDPQTSEKIELVGGTGAEILGGVAGAVLGLLALVGIAPAILLACASIVFGAALLLGSASETSAKNYLSRAVASTPRNEQIILQSAAGAEVLVGLAAIALGILALVGFAPMTLILVSFLSLGAGAIIAGSALGGTMMWAYRSR